MRVRFISFFRVCAYSRCTCQSKLFLRGNFALEDSRQRLASCWKIGLQASQRNVFTENRRYIALSYALLLWSLILLWPFSFFFTVCASLRKASVTIHGQSRLKVMVIRQGLLWRQASLRPKIGFSYVLLCVSNGLFVKQQQHSIPNWECQHLWPFFICKIIVLGTFSPFFFCL